MPWSRWLLALGDGTLPFLNPVTGAQLPDQSVLRMRGGAHFVAVPDGICIFTDQTELLQWRTWYVVAHNATVDVLNALLLQAVP